jgi:hypothetical protein
MAFGLGGYLRTLRTAPHLWLQPAVLIPELLQQLLTFGLPFQIIQHESSPARDGCLTQMFYSRQYPRRNL